MKKSSRDRDFSNKKRDNVFTIILGICDVIAIIVLFLLYGPFHGFRDFLVTTAMSTMRHQYLATTFYSDEYIEKVLKRHSIMEPEGNTDISEIIGTEEVYIDDYDREILDRNKNDLYKIIEIDEKGFSGYLVAIYDPAKIRVTYSKNLGYSGEYLVDMAKREGAVIAINGGGFVDIEGKSNGGQAIGAVISNGKIISNYGYSLYGGGIIGFTNDNKLLLTKKSATEAVKMGVRDGMSFGPFLVVNGEPSKFRGNGGYGIAPRTAIGQRKDGIVLMLVIDGRRPGHSLGVDMVELTNIMVKYGAYNASNLDGGGSSSMVVDGEVLSVAGGSGYTGERYLPNAWIVK